MNRNETMLHIRESKIIAIVRGIAQADLFALADALYAGGITLMEVTFDARSPDTWPGTAAAIAGLNKRFGDKVLMGAGTVITAAQVRLAAEAGAAYIISPHTDESVIRTTLDAGMVSLPGAYTPTEIMAAHSFGADAVKVFPAGVAGPAYIKAVAAPLSHIPLMAVGGIDENNAAAFIRAGAVALGVGGRLADKTLIAAQAFDEITAIARAHRAAVQ